MLNVVRGLVNDFVSLLDEHSGFSSGSGNSQRISSGHRPYRVPRPAPSVVPRRVPVPPPVPAPLPIPVPPQFHPTRLYHGSSLEKVTEIFRTHLFLVGESTPPAFWMADTPQKTRSYCGNNGGILVIDVVSGAPLTDRGGGIYIYEIKGAQPYQEYYEIPHLRPVAVLDPTAARRIG